jgi:chemotaxis family two-component system response regulator Rcp1
MHKWARLQISVVGLRDDMGAEDSRRPFGNLNTLVIDLLVGLPMAPREIRLLVVEDSSAYRDLVQRAFRQLGGQTRWKIVIAKDGKEALELLFAEESEQEPLPDLILLDWNLPKVSGNEVLMRLKEHQRLRKIPVLIFSSSDADADIHAADGNYANGYITKPGSLDVLNSMVETIEQFWITVAQIPKIARPV